jgi:hypothetical protein
MRFEIAFFLRGEDYPDGKTIRRNFGHYLPGLRARGVGFFLKFGCLLSAFSRFFGYAR